MLCLPALALGSTVATIGRWATPLANGLYICRDRGTAWIWTNSSEVPRNAGHEPGVSPRETIISYIDSSGTVIRSWSIASEIDSVEATHDCRVAWFIDVDRLHLLWLDRESSDAPIGLAPGTSLDDGIKQLTAAEDYRHAWVRFSADRPIANLERTPTGIVAMQIQNGAATAGEVNVQAGYRGDRLAIVPQGDGLWIADREHTWSVPSLSHVSVMDVDPADEGRLFWVVPQNEGLFLIDDHGASINYNGADNFLPKEDVSEIRAGPTLSYAALTTNYCWVKTINRNLYLFQTLTAADGKRSVAWLNDGKPVSEPHGGAALHVDAVEWVGDDGLAIWPH